MKNMQCCQHAYVAIWPRRGAEKCVVADGGWSVESWGHSDLLMVAMQGESRTDNLGDTEGDQRVQSLSK